MANVIDRVVSSDYQQQYGMQLDKDARVEGSTF
jgi:hypothetical protein